MMFSIRSILRPSSSSAVVLHSSFYSSSSSSSSAAAIQAERTILQGPRNDWSRDEIRAVYDSPVLDLLFHGVSIYAMLPLCVFFLKNLGKEELKPLDYGQFILRLVQLNLDSHFTVTRIQNFSSTVLVFSSFVISLSRSFSGSSSQTCT